MGRAGPTASFISQERHDRHLTRRSRNRYHAGKAKGNRSAVFAFVNDQTVIVGIGDRQHPANGTFVDIHHDFHVGCFDFIDERLEIVDLEGGRCAVRRWLPELAVAFHNGETAAANVIFNPVWRGFFAPNARCLEAQDAFVERAGSFDVGYGVSGECDFEYFHIDMRRARGG